MRIKNVNDNSYWMKENGCFNVNLECASEYKEIDELPEAIETNEGELLELFELCYETTNGLFVAVVED